MIRRYSDFAEKASKQSSERESIAMQIERKAEDCYKAEYARRHLGECYEGTISGVTQRGLFVELENGVEGFVPASSLTPSGTNLTEGIRLSAPVAGKSWSLGDSMMITIVRADVNQGKVDIEVAEADGPVEYAEVFDKALNAFKVRYYGSAKNVTLKLHVIGGLY